MKEPVKSFFRLKVTRIDRACKFELSWGKGQQLCATLDYPENVIDLYKTWELAYTNFYTSQTIDGDEPEGSSSTSQMRARLEDAGTMAPPPGDRHAKLVQAKVFLNSEFHQWLHGGELYEIRKSIASAATATSGQNHVDVFLTCNTIELEYLPWETWEIGVEFGSGLVQISRTPVNIRYSPVKQRRGRTRILVILGDDTQEFFRIFGALLRHQADFLFDFTFTYLLTGLNFQPDKEAVLELSRIAYIEFVKRELGENAQKLRNKICQALVSKPGWDALLFAGHTDESILTGGELVIAPDVVMSISEIKPQLLKAIQQGLQFALFNSCSGIKIAESLIDLGFSQVVVMRQRIHNQVAQIFLRKFMQALATECDVQEALQHVCHELRINNNQTFPSAYLIPSLFRHPEAPLFRIQSRAKQLRQELIPTGKQAVALSTLLCLSLVVPIQDLLLAPRLLVQAIYRDVTNQVLPVTAKLPVVLLQIDEKSIEKSGISSPNPMDRSYLAQLINQLSLTNAKIVGLDYFLDRQQPGNDERLAKSIRHAVEQGKWFVFAAYNTPDGETGINLDSGIAILNWSLQGYTDASFGYVELFPGIADCSVKCPYAYLLAMAYKVNQLSHANLPQPQLSSQTNFRDRLFNYLKHEKQVNQIQNSHLLRLPGWQPLIDFSIPPNRVYDRIPAWKFLKLSTKELKALNLQQKIVIIAPGGYTQMGMGNGQDNDEIPLAIYYWYWRYPIKAPGDNSTSTPEVFTGSEEIAYAVHHLVNHRLVVPIPDWWMIGVAVLLGKGTVLIWKRQRQLLRWKIILASGTIIYGLAGLQIYISAAVLLPWFLPSLAFWVCVLPSFSRKNSYRSIRL